MSGRPIRRLQRFGWLLALLPALAVRLPGLFGSRFFADEALFATWARLIAVWRDPLLLAQAVDKPPLAFYLQALFYPLFGPVEWAARLPNLIASLLLVPLTALLAWRLYRSPLAAIAAGLVVALSPYAIQFAPTAFLDPLLTTWLVATAVFTAGSPARARWGGLLFGLALLTKYQALLFLPLLIGIGWWRGWRRLAWRRWIVGTAVPLAALLLWSAARGGGLALWTAQMRNYGGLRLAWSWELWPRARAWLALWPPLVGDVSLALLLAAGLGWLIWRAWRRPAPDAVGGVDLLLILFLGGYQAAHWLLAVPVWDRYLLPLLPLAALLIGRLLALAARALGGRARPSAALLLLLGLLLVQPALDAARGTYPVGGRRDADAGAALVAAWLADAPYGTVLYDHWYSWQWRYHLFDRRVYVAWVPHPAALAQDLVAFGGSGPPRYLALPQTAAARPFLRAAATAGFSLTPVFLPPSGTIGLYQLTEGSPP